MKMIPFQLMSLVLLSSSFHLVSSDSNPSTSTTTTTTSTSSSEQTSLDELPIFEEDVAPIHHYNQMVNIVPHNHLTNEKRQGTSTTPTTTTVSTSSINIPQTAPAGGLIYTQPAITAPVSYYKIMPSNPITFGWNFTSLYVQPQSLTFIAYCSANSFTYPVGPTNGISGQSTQLVWDPYQYQISTPNAIPFAQASYTLRVYDERGLEAIATAGYFNGANSVVNFAMYSPAAYTPLADGWKCIGCSAAFGLLSRLNQPLLLALPITLSLVLIGGAGVLNR